MKRDVRLKFYLHAEIALVVFVCTRRTSGVWLHRGVRVLRPDRKFIELRFETRFDVSRRPLLPGIAQLFVNRDFRIVIKDADRYRVMVRGDLARPVDVRRIVLLLVLVDLGQVRAELQTFFVR